MKTIVIKKSKNYIKKSILMLLMIFVLYLLVDFFKNPSEHTYFLLPTKNSVIIFSLFGFISILIAMYFIFRSFFNKDGFLRIDKDGLFNSFFIYDKKSINWEEIKRIETTKYNYNNYVLLFLKETINNEKGIKSFYFSINKSTMGTPYFINVGDLDCTFEELREMIYEAYENSKKTS